MKGMINMKFYAYENGCEVDIDPKEKEGYIKYVKGKNPKKIIKYIKVTLDGDFANLEYEVEEEPFDRIRRITGYLVGDTKYWNNAKKAEERDRVKHG